MADQIIRPADLPNRANPVASEKVPVDNGVTVGGATIQSIVESGRPAASQSEAEAGVNSVKAMTPLTVKQAIDAQVPIIVGSAIDDLDLGTAAQADVSDFATAAQGSLADSAVQPGDLATVATTGSYNDLTDKPTLSDETSAESRAWAISNLHPISAPTFIRTAGYGAPGDVGGALYRLVVSEPSHPGKFSITLDDGVTLAWYEIAEAEISPLMIGVLRNNAMDQTTGLQAWLNVLKATSASGVVPKGVYKQDSEISIDASGLKVRCHRKAVFDMAAAPVGSYGLTVAGTLGTYANGSVGTFLVGTTRIRTGASFAQARTVGECLKIKSDDIYDSFNTSAKYGELNKIVGLSDAATGYIDIEIPLSATYATTPQVAVVTPVTALDWEGGCWEGNPTNMNNQKAVRLRHVVDFDIKGVSARRMDDRAFWVEDCALGDISDFDIADAQPASTGYGVSVIDACQDIIIHHGKFSRVRHSLSTNNQIAGISAGIPRRITFADNMCTGGAYAQTGSMGPGDMIDTHGAAEDIYIERNTTVGCPGQGINFECRSGVVRDNKVIGCGGNGISVHNESDFNGSVIVEGNSVLRAGGKGMYLVNGTRGTLASYDLLIVANNAVEGASAEGIQVGYAAQAGKLLGLIVNGNRVRGNGATGLYILNARRAAVSGNNVDGNGSAAAIRFFDSFAFTATGNSASQPSGSTSPGIQVTGTTAGASLWGVISGNIVSPQSGSFSGSGVVLDNNTQYTNVSGNTVRGSGGVSLGTGTGNAQANNIV